jgi:hypothetical protein
MLDLVFVVLTIVFFALCWSLLIVCGRLAHSRPLDMHNAQAGR